MRRTSVLLTVALLAGCGTGATPTMAPASPNDPAPTDDGSSPTAPPSVTSLPPSPSPPPDWTEAASFGGDGIEAARDVVDTPFGLIAVGVHHPGTSLPVFGPVPQEGRVWHSDDGHDWADVTPAQTFANASLHTVVSLPDGAVVAFGNVSIASDAGNSDEYRAWETRDGVSWNPTTILAEDQPVISLVEGGKGYLGLVAHRDAPGSDIWYSSDGRTFDHPYRGPSFDAMWGSIAAGDEGFVATTAGGLTEPSTTVSASADGIEWFNATSPPGNAHLVAPIGPDWVAIESEPGQPGEIDSTASWSSANGLEWNLAGELPLGAIDAGGGAGCTEFASGLHGTGDVAIVSTTLTYPCSEGGVVRYGQSSITSDGVSWDPLEFTGASDLSSVSRGTTINAAIALGDRLILVGEKDLQATFWLFE
jgi:hypothetical protein